MVIYGWITSYLISSSISKIDRAQREAIRESSRDRSTDLWKYKDKNLIYVI